MNICLPLTRETKDKRYCFGVTVYACVLTEMFLIPGNEGGGGGGRGWLLLVFGHQRARECVSE